MTRALFRIALVAGCAMALAACVSLLPKSKPAQLYRFGAPAAAKGPVTAPQRRIGVFQTNGDFEEAAAGDRILTVTGGRASFIAQSRWVAPASVLFSESVAAAFEAAAGPVRLVARGQQGKADYALRLDVRSFESRYEAGESAAPTVVVRVHAALTRGDQTTVGEEVFEARAPAADNRVGAIVAAYDSAVADVLGKLVAWTNARVT